MTSGDVRFDILLYTRGITKNEDYHLVMSADYMDQYAIHSLVNKLLDIRNLIPEFAQEQSKKVGIFAIFDDFCVFLRAFSSTHRDPFGRLIFSVEGFTCPKKDVNFLYMNIPNIIIDWGDNKETFQDLYYKNELKASQYISNAINVVDYIFNDEVVAQNSLSSVHMQFLEFIKQNTMPTPIIIGEQADVLAKEVGESNYYVIDTCKDFNFQRMFAKQPVKRICRMQVYLTISGDINKKGKFSYRWECYNANSTEAEGKKTLICQTEYSTPNENIPVAKLLKEHSMISQVLLTQGYFNG